MAAFALATILATAPVAHAGRLVCGGFDCGYQAARGEVNRVSLTVGPGVVRPGGPGMLDVQRASFVLSDAVSIQIQGGGCRYTRPPSRRVVRCVLESDDQTLFASFALGDGSDTAAVRLPKATPFQLWFGAGSGNDHVTVVSPTGGSYDGDIRLGPGSDLFYGGAGAERAGGDAGNDTLHGRGGNDNLRGGSGFDRLFGGPGNDVLDGVLRETRFG